MSALSNLKVLDFSTLLPGPFAGMMLADWGADIIRVESPTRADLVREIPPFSNGVSSKHAMLNRNKRAITLDLKESASIELIKKMILDYDIILEQFRPGVMDRLGLGYETLKEINPKLIYCSITGFGQTGPYRDRAGHDNNYISIAGLNGYSGRKGERTPIMGTQIADIAGGSLHSVIGILTAVNHRHVTGEGQYVDVSMTDATFSLNAMFGSDYLTAGQNPEKESSMLTGGSFYDYYETADNRHISVGSIEPHFFKRLCTTLGGEELFALGCKQDKDSQITFKQTLTDTFKQKSLADWTEIFSEKDACVEPVLSFAEACENEQIVAREMITEVPMDDGSLQRQIASPFKLSNCKPKYEFVGGSLGANNQEIFEAYNFKND